MAFVSSDVSLLLLFLSVSSPSFVHASAVDCSTVILNMASCLSFVTIGSTVEKPEASCCTGLKKVLDTSAICLCQGLKNSGFKLNVTKASTLPQVCKLDAPPMSSCGLSTTPPPANTTTTTPPASTPAPVPTAGSGSGSADSAHVPAPGPAQKSHGSSLIPISGLTFIIMSGALAILFSRF